MPTQNSDVLNGNKIIAEFMGVKLHDKLPHWEVAQWELTPGSFYINLQYHTSLDWLMPVVSKISDIACFDGDGHSELYVKAGEVMSTQVCVGIDILWERIIKFIEWYNSQLKNSNQ